VHTPPVDEELFLADKIKQVLSVYLLYRYTCANTNQASREIEQLHQDITATNRFIAAILTASRPPPLLTQANNAALVPPAGAALGIRSRMGMRLSHPLHFIAHTDSDSNIGHNKEV
jgi:hypothetical protein